MADIEVKVILRNEQLRFTSSAQSPRNSAVISWAKLDQIACLWTAEFAFFRNLLLSSAILAC